MGLYFNENGLVKNLILQIFERNIAIGLVSSIFMVFIIVIHFKRNSLVY